MARRLLLSADLWDLMDFWFCSEKSNPCNQRNSWISASRCARGSFVRGFGGLNGLLICVLLEIIRGICVIRGWLFSRGSKIAFVRGFMGLNGFLFCRQLKFIRVISVIRG